MRTILIHRSATMKSLALHIAIAALLLWSALPAAIR